MEDLVPAPLQAAALYQCIQSLSQSLTAGTLLALLKSPKPVSWVSNQTISYELCKIKTKLRTLKTQQWDRQGLTSLLQVGGTVENQIQTWTKLNLSPGYSFPSPSFCHTKLTAWKYCWHQWKPLKLWVETIYYKLFSSDIFVMPVFCKLTNTVYESIY